MDSILGTAPTMMGIKPGTSQSRISSLVELTRTPWYWPENKCGEGPLRMRRSPPWCGRKSTLGLVWRKWKQSYLGPVRRTFRNIPSIIQVSRCFQNLPSNLPEFLEMFRSLLETLIKSRLLSNSSPSAKNVVLIEHADYHKFAA